MRKIMILFSVVVVVAFSFYDLPSDVTAQEVTPPPTGVDALRLLGPVTTALGEALEINGEFEEQPRNGVTILHWLVRVINPSPINPDEENCSQTVPVEVPIGPAQTFYLLIRRDEGKLTVNGEDTPLSDCLSNAVRMMTDLAAPIPNDYREYVTDPSKLREIPRLLGLNKIKGGSAILGPNNETKAQGSGVGEDGIFLSVHNLHVF